MEEHETTEVTPESSLGDALEGAGSKSLRDTIVTAPSTDVPKSGEETTTQTHM